MQPWFKLSLSFRRQWWALTNYGAVCFHWGEM